MAIQPLLLRGFPDSHDGLCQRCLKEQETDLHRYWPCEKNKGLDIAAIDNSEHLAKFAVKGEESDSIFWCRGVPTRNMFEFPQPQDQYDVRQIGDPQVLVLDRVNVFSDGSGGKYSDIPLLRRCGWAWVFMQERSCAFARWSPLASLPQTVPRVELTAVIDAMQTVTKHCFLVATLDAQTLQRIFSSILAAFRRSPEEASLTRHSSPMAICGLPSPTNWQSVKANVNSIGARHMPRPIS